MTNSDQWFIRSQPQRKIRGPFSLSILVSMKDRGRIDPSTEISSDRRNWTSAGSFPELFPQLADVPRKLSVGPPSVPPNHSSGMPQRETTALSTIDSGRELAPVSEDFDNQCFYSLDGVVHGPVSLATLQSRCASAQVAPTDFIWIEGTSGWVAAGSLSQLKFPTFKQSFISWLRNNPALATCLILVVVFILIIPTWYVFASGNYRLKQENEARRLAEEIRQRAEKERKDILDRLEKERQDILHNKEELAKVQQATSIQIAQIQTQLELIKSQDKRDKDREAQLNRLEIEQKRHNQLLEEYNSQFSQNAKSFKDMMEESNAEQRKQTKELVRQTWEIQNPRKK